MSGSWIEVRDRYEARLAEAKEALRAERRATTRAHKHFFDFLEEIGQTDAFVTYLKRAQNQRRAA